MNTARYTFAMALLIASSSTARARQQPEFQDFTASDTVMDDRFGWAADVSGDTAIIGARLHTATALNQGAAYIFKRATTGWIEVQELVASDAEPADTFGHSVSIDGRTAVVGARFDDDGGPNAGSAYVFERGSNGWREVAKLRAPDATAHDRFGHSVTVSDDLILVGCPWDDDKGPESGSAYVFRRTTTGWVPDGKLLAQFGRWGDRFGHSVALDGRTAVVGAPNRRESLIDNWGAAYVFERTPSGWVQTAKLLEASPNEDDLFGQSVDIDGDVIVVGEPVTLAPWSPRKGAAFVFERSATSPQGWLQTAELMASDGSCWGADCNKFGRSVSVDGNRIAVGALWQHHQNLLTGAVYLYQRGPSGWSEVTKLVSSDLLEAELGTSVAMDGSFVLAGAPVASDVAPSAGKVYAYGLPLGSPYCTAVANSTGQPASIHADGSPYASDGTLHLRATELPVDAYGMFLAGRTQASIANPAGSQGTLCVGSPLGRLSQQTVHTGAAGTFEIFVDMTAVPMSSPTSILPGETWNFQAWYRDSNPGPTSNFTDGVTIDFR